MSKPHSKLHARRAKVQHLLNANRLEEALPFLKQIAKADPKDGPSWFLIAAIHGQLGQHEAAVTAGRRAVELQPGNADAWANLGTALYETFHYDDAIEMLERALSLAPGHLHALVHLGNACDARGESEAAERVYRKALAINPNIPEIHHNLGDIYRVRADLDTASGFFRQAIHLDHHFSESRVALASILMERGHHQQAIEQARLGLKYHAHMPRAYRLMVHAYESLQDDEQALETCRRLLEIEPDAVRNTVLLANTLWSFGYHSESNDVYEELLEKEPGNAVIKVGWLRNQALQRNTELVYEELDQLIEEKRSQVAVAAMFSQFCQRVGRCADAVTLLERALEENPKLKPYQRLSLYFALGSTLDRIEEYPRAFEYYREGNELRKKVLGDWQVWKEQNHRHMNGLTGCFTTQNKTLRPRSELDTDIPVFIVGMPRSGTSLTEQILASHPGVSGAGELNTIPLLVRELETTHGRPYHETLPRLSGEELTRMGQVYLDRLEKFRESRTRYITDKLPGNALNLGLISMLFPNARVIHCLREPMDNCLSIYFQSFKENLSYSHDLHDIGVFYRRQARLMDHWRSSLDIPILDIHYEDTVADQEAVTRRMLEFIGLEWDDACLSFHRSERQVKTASYEQVKQPIYKTSVARWKHYEPWLGPLREALEESRD